MVASNPRGIPMPIQCVADQLHPFMRVLLRNSIIKINCLCWVNNLRHFSKFGLMSSLNSLHILLVEDDEDDVELMQDALRDNGVPFEMDIVRQGDEVIPFLKSCKNFPSVILLDLNLPKMHGREVLSRIKLSDDFEHIPVAILTTSSSKVEKEFCLSAGASHFLTKPSTVEGFNKTIEAIKKIVLQHQQR